MSEPERRSKPRIARQTPGKRPYHALSVIPDIDRIILEGIAAGRSLKSIADEHGVNDTAILYRCLRNYPDAYAQARTTGAELRMDRREQQLEEAADNVSVTRADRLLGHARWLAERSCPERWGRDSPTAQTVVVLDADLSSLSALLRGRVIESNSPK